MSRSTWKTCTALTTASTIARPVTSGFALENHFMTMSGIFTMTGMSLTTRSLRWCVLNAVNKKIRTVLISSPSSNRRAVPPQSRAQNLAAPQVSTRAVSIPLNQELKIPTLLAYLSIKLWKTISFSIHLISQVRLWFLKICQDCQTNLNCNSSGVWIRNISNLDPFDT